MNPNPAFGAHLQPFSGIPSFMRQPATRELEGVDVAIVGIPYDGGTSHRSGARFGPRKIREASLMLWGYHHTHQVAPLEVLRVVDYGDVEVSPVDIEATNTAIANEVSAVLKSGARVISLGGDHSITLPLLRAHAAQHRPVGVVHFDSHCDTGSPEFAGRPYSHGTPFRCAIQEGLIDTSAYLQIGIRGPSSRATYRSDAQALGARVITIDEAFEIGMSNVIKEIHALVGARRVYVSLDIDAADPAYAPGTGTPEVGGFTSYQLLQLVRGLVGLELIGFDLVEVSPPYDHGDITAILAVNLAFDFLALLARKKIDNTNH